MSARFWSKVQRGDGCWEWQGGTNSDGYGSHSVCGVNWKAHRYAWHITNGPIKDGLYVCHMCDNRTCVNPAHMFLGTVYDNISDMDQKGRRAVGTQNGKAKMTEAIVHRVRELRSLGYSFTEIAAQVGMSKGAVQHVVSGATWSHL